MQYKQAKGVALRILKQIEPFCEWVAIAGSIRREKPEVGDIEIVCLPRKTQITNLFGEVIGSKTNTNFASIVNSLGIVIKGNPDGRYMQIELLDGINLDLFMPIKTDIMRQYAIRTGGADYSHKVLATAWNKKGWVGTENGLRLEKECFPKDLGGGKKKWICNNANPTLPPVWENELEFFHWLGLEWKEPCKRYV